MVPMGENSGKTAKRGRGRPFQPGQSGNPGGRPKEDAPVRDLARQHTAEAIRKLTTIMRSGKQEQAAALTLDQLLRGTGR